MKPVVTLHDATRDYPVKYLTVTIPHTNLYLTIDEAMDLAIDLVFMASGDLIEVSSSEGIVKWNPKSKFLKHYTKRFKE